MAIRKYRASLGTVSHGTCRMEDLLDSFASELESSRLTKAQRETVKEARKWLRKASRGGNAKIRRDGSYVAGSFAEFEESGSELVSELIDILDSYAMPYTYFGAHEGDGSDYGFWPIWDQIDELPHVDDSDAARALGEDCKAVNDHGNVTLYNGHGKVIWDCV